MTDQSAERLTEAIHSLIEAMGMQAENENRKHRGESIAYTDEAFRAIRFGGAKYLPMSPSPSPTVEELPSDEEIAILSPYPMEVQGHVDWMNGAIRMRERAAPIISRLKGDIAEAKTAYRTATEMLEEERKVCDRNINQTITTKRELTKLRNELRLRLLRQNQTRESGIEGQGDSEAGGGTKDTGNVNLRRGCGGPGPLGRPLTGGTAQESPR